MFQLDGSSNSKPSRRPSIASTRSDTENPKNRFANLLPSFKHTATDLSTIDPHNEIIDADNPIRMVSPRATGSEPPATLRKKQRTLSFKSRKTDKSKSKPDAAALQPEKKAKDQPDATLQPHNTMSENAGPHITVTEATSNEQPDTTAQDPESAPAVSNGAHIPTTDAPYPCQPRKDSVGFGSPTRETALTSHPVVKRQEVDGESEFATPMSEVVREYFKRKE
jgi:hypothetical protein